MADEKTFTESEHIAVLTDRVAKETADLTAARDQLASEKSELETKLDVAESAKQAAEQRAEKAEKDLADFKAQIEADREAAARKDERLAKVRESAKHLEDAFFEDEARVNRIVAMKDEDFAGYIADLQATATKAPADGGVPRETAMSGTPAQTGEGTGGAGRTFLLGAYESQEG